MSPLGTGPDTVFGVIVVRSFIEPISLPGPSGYWDVVRGYRSWSITGPWSSNSPLPPNYRYVELEDIKWATLGIGVFDLEAYFGIPDASIFLPRNQDSVIMHNLKQLPILPATWFLPEARPFVNSLDSIYNDDTYWTGTVRDPVKWKDKYWDAQGVDRDAIAAYLEAHPGSKLY